MALGIRCTMFFQLDANGWSETHWNIAASDLVTARNDLLELVKKRLAIAGHGVRLIGGRVSRDGVFRDSKVLDLSPVGAVPFKVKATDYNGNQIGQGWDAEDMATCVLARGESMEDRRKSLYLSGIPDGMIATGEDDLNYNAVPGWVVNWEAYRDLLKTPIWGFRTRVRPADDVNATPKAVTGWQVEAAAPLRVGFIVADGQAGADYTIGQKVQLRNFTMRQRVYRTINGVYTVGAVTDDSSNNRHIYFLNGTENRDPNTFLAPGTIERVLYNSYRYDDVVLLRKGRRKRGRPFNLPPGRLTTPVRI